ncbi:MAG: DUF2284 domain-containing protein [Clostridiales bacterium]|nr:DUF2284 domain-containing protein [Clostridiales bacterium]
MLEEIIKYVRELGYPIYGCMINSSDLVFEERVRMNCFYCGKYNNAWKCPPRIPELDYKKMFSEFDNIAMIYVSLSLQEGKDYSTVRTESSVKLHLALLECEKWLYQHNNSTALSFIGGSCKLCKSGCAPTKCANPYKARTPVEALGINILRTASKYGLEITFPPDKDMKRVGLLLW